MTNWKKFWASPKGKAKRKNAKKKNTLTRSAQKKFSKESPVYDKYSDTW